MKIYALSFALATFALSLPALAHEAPAPAVIVGGYSAASVKDEGVRIAALFAVKAHSVETKKPHKLKKILTAQTQVVAGINYKLCFSVTEGKHHNESHLIEAVVYQDLQRKLSLTSWKHAKSCV